MCRRRRRRRMERVNKTFKIENKPWLLIVAKEIRKHNDSVRCEKSYDLKILICGAVVLFNKL